MINFFRGQSVDSNSKTMINFFRRIRRKLADDNKPLKYARYAIGEIVLVVIGILIALSINTWNEDQKDRENEKYYLGQLVIDLNEDIETLKNEKKNISDQIPIIENLLEVVDDEQPNITTFNNALKKYMNAVWYPLRFQPNSPTFEEMKSSGKLALIKDNDLRNSIVVLYRNLENCQKLFEANNEFLEPHVIDLSFNKGMAVFLKDQSSMFSKFNSDTSLYAKLKYKDDFINNAANQHWTISEILPAIDIQLDNIQKVLNEINKNLPSDKAFN